MSRQQLSVSVGDRRKEHGAERREHQADIAKGKCRPETSVEQWKLWLASEAQGSKSTLPLGSHFGSTPMHFRAFNVPSFSLKQEVSAQMGRWCKTRIDFRLFKVRP